MVTAEPLEPEPEPEPEPEEPELVEPEPDEPELDTPELDEPEGVELLPVEPVEALVVAGDTAADVVVGLSGPLLVRGDERQLRQVLANLVRNALVHTPAGTPVELSGEGDGQDVVLLVRDHGPGLPPGQGAKVFERFSRAEPGRERGPAGAGLGLAIVAAHDGRAEATDAPGGGAAFRITLPAFTTDRAGAARARA